VIGKRSIFPTNHFIIHHSDVEWDLVLNTVLCASKSWCNRRYGKNRFTYVKKYKKFVIEVHAQKDEVNQLLWIINAFKMPR